MKKTKKAKLNKPLKVLSLKVVLLGLAFVLALSSCIFMTVAWYTKMVSVSGLEFKTAEWDFTANYAVSGIVVNVYEYSTITNTPEPLAAPGTKGYIPLKLSAWQSDTDVSFTLLLDRKTMSEEFQKRIFFYYYKDANGAISNVETGNKIYLNGSPEAPNADQVLMEGTVPRGNSTEVYIFWEWLYEAPEGATDAEKKTWDEFDTNVGKNPAIYVDDMNAKISIAGVQAEPVRADGKT